MIDINWSSDKLNYISHYTKLSPLCSTHLNKYTPLFARFNGLFVSKGDKKMILYFPIIRASYSRYRDTDVISRNFFTAVNNGEIQKYKVGDEIYYTMKHFIYQVDSELNVKILYSIVFETEYLINTLAQRNMNLNLNKAKVIIDRDFYNGEGGYSSVKRRLHNFINEIRGVDIIQTLHMDEWFANDKITLPTFANLQERFAYVERIKSLMQ